MQRKLICMSLKSKYIADCIPNNMFFVDLYGNHYVSKYLIGNETVMKKIFLSYHIQTNKSIVLVSKYCIKRNNNFLQIDQATLH